MLTDIHCHLDEMAGIEKLIERAKENNVQQMFSNSVDLKSMHANLELSNQYPEIKTLLGLHPKDILEMPKEEIEHGLKFMEEKLSNRKENEIAGVGEIGLDYKYAETEEQKKIQQELFEQQIELGKEYNLHVQVHSRRARNECLKTLEKCHAEKVLLHWFNGNKKQVQEISDKSWFISIGPSVLFDNYNHEMVDNLPLENLLLETDTPVPFGGKNAEPAWIAQIAEKVAQIKNCTRDEVEKQTGKNMQTLLKK